MRIALVIMPSWSVDTAPLGIASVAATLREAGHEVKVFDFNVALWHRFKHLHRDPWNYSDSFLWREEAEFEKSLYPDLKPAMDELMQAVADWEPELAGFSIYDTSIHCTRRAAQTLKGIRPCIKVIYGGPGVKRQALEYHREFARSAIDFAVIGEGEATVIDLVGRLARREPTADCPGIAYADAEGKLVCTPARANIDLKNLPKPYFGDFNFDLYRHRSLPVMMSRGCVAKCTFCAETRFWNNFRYREAEAIFQEFLNNKRTYGIAKFAMADSLINGNFKVLSELADLIIASGEQFSWSGYARLDKRMSPDLLRRLKLAGLQFFNFGLETGSQKVMDLMEKRTTVEAASQVIKDCHAAGIVVSVNIIVGFPGETEADFQDTLKFLGEHNKEIGAVSCGEPLAILHNTPLEQNPKKYGIRTDENGRVKWDVPGEWISDDPDGPNTMAKRMDRLWRLQDFLAQFPHIRLYGGRPRPPQPSRIEHFRTFLARWRKALLPSLGRSA